MVSELRAKVAGLADAPDVGDVSHQSCRKRTPSSANVLSVARMPRKLRQLRSL